MGSRSSDAAGEAYVSGYTFSADFPVTSNGFQQVNNGTANVDVNAFVSRLNATGTGLIDSTYLGGTGLTKGGSSNSAGPIRLAMKPWEWLWMPWEISMPRESPHRRTFQPLRAHTRRPTRPPPIRQPMSSSAKLDPTLSTLIYSTYVGGSGIVSSADLIGQGDFATGIALDTADDAYITGITESRDFPVTGDAFQSGPRSPQVVDSGFFTEVNPNGSALQYSTYLGGSGAGFFGGTDFRYF